MRFASGVVLALASTLVPPAFANAQLAPALPGTQLAVAPGKPYDQVANCLMKQIAGGPFIAWPLVYAPPRREALVNVWRRGRETDAPVAVFHVTEANGTTRVNFEQPPGALGPRRAAAEAAAQQCLR